MSNIKSLRVFLFLLFVWLPMTAHGAPSLIKSSLNAAGAVTVGGSFGRIFGGGCASSVTFLVTGAAPSLTLELDVQDPNSGAWVPYQVFVLTGTLTTAQQVVVLSGPVADARAQVTAWTSGTITVTIVATY